MMPGLVKRAVVGSPRFFCSRQYQMAPNTIAENERPAPRPTPSLAGSSFLVDLAVGLDSISVVDVEVAELELAVVDAQLMLS